MNRKVRKLLRDPSLFTRDMLGNLERRPATRKFRKLVKDPSLFVRDLAKNRFDDVRRRLRRLRATRRYSVIAAVYGVERYLEKFFVSMERQTLGFEKHVELIMVDDGSPDGSAEIIARWQAKYPSAIRYVRKENGGQASARNVGLEHATGDWVTFVDPDDFVDPAYFERVDELLDRPDAAGVVLVGCKFVYYDEKTKRTRDAHPLRYRFAAGDRVVPPGELAADMQLSAATAFFRGDALRRQGLRFDERIRPVFEDAHFTSRYLLHEPGGAVAFCASSTYYYRKREDESSTLDGAWTNPSLFDEVLEIGCLDLLRRAEALSGDGTIPVWLQRVVFYHLIWYFKRLVDNAESVSFLTEDQRSRFRGHLLALMSKIDHQTIVAFELGGFWLFHKIGVLGLFKSAQPEFQHVYAQDYDPVKEVVQLRYFHHGGVPLEVFEIDGVEVFPAFAKTQRHDFLGESFVDERIIWLPVRGQTGRLRVCIGGCDTRVLVRGRVHRDGVALRELTRARRAPDPRKLDPRTRLEYRLATSRLAARRYGDSFLFMDRDVQADDNAEHLYRYIARNRPEINAFFVLRRSSHDWDRLARDGFRLLEFGSLQHRIALLHAKHLISSHVDHYVVTHPSGPELTAHMQARFTFLQHGVTKDDISRWLNGKQIDCLVTASPAEHASIVDDGTPYKFCDREVVLSGFPRHDALGAGAGAPERLLAVMPTWRASLVGKTKGAGNARELNPDFYDSGYARAWKSLLHAPELRRLAEEHHYRVQFFPHANIQPYLEWFDPPSYVETMSHDASRSMQEVFRSASIMLTDYSSTAFEMAYLRKGVLYYQFDRDLVFGGGHLTRKGYFDYDRDGFGPVCQDERSLLAALHELMRAGGAPSPEHLARMDRTFAFRDGRSCERTLEAILALDAPEHPRARSAELLVAAARSASARGAWTHAERRWARVLELDDARRPAEAGIFLAEAKRVLGKVDEAGELLDVAAARLGECEAIRTARAELATSAEQWARAAELWSELARRRGAAGVVERVRAAEAYRKLGDLEAAARSLDAIPGDRVSIDARVGRAELASASGRWEDAADAWAELARDPDAPEQSLLRVAEALVESSRLEPGLRALDAYLSNPRPLEERRARALRLGIREALRTRGEHPTQSAPETSDVHEVEPCDTADGSASRA